MAWTMPSGSMRKRPRTSTPCLVINAVDRPDPSPRRRAWERETALHHFAQFVLLHIMWMKRLSVPRGQHLDAQLAEFVGFGGDRRQFGGSDEGEIAGVEAEHHPLSLEFGQLDVLGVPRGMRMPRNRGPACPPSRSRSPPFAALRRLPGPPRARASGQWAPPPAARSLVVCPPCRLL